MAKKSSVRRRAPVGPQKRRARGTSASSLAIPVIVGVVVLAVIVGAIFFNENRRAAAGDLAAVDPGDLSVPVVTVGPQPTAALPFPDVPRISLKDTQTRLQRGQAVLVDVRDKASYDQGHATGAILMPQEEIMARLSELPRDKALILYCT